MPLVRVKRWSMLESPEVRLMTRVGVKEAAVAAARKIAVVHSAGWRDASAFQPSGLDELAA